VKRAPGLVAALVTLVAGAPAWARPPAESGARPLVRLILPAGTAPPPGLLRGELEAVGFAVDQRPGGDGEDAAIGMARKDGVFAVVIANPSGERALAEVIVLGTTSPLFHRTTIDLGATRDLDEGETMHVQGTLSVRVAELLRTAATNAARRDAALSAPRAAASASHGTDERGASPPPLLGPVRAAPPPSLATPAAETPTPSPATPAAKTPVISAPPVREIGLDFELGLAAGRSLEAGAGAIGPRLRFTWTSPSGWLVGASTTGLTFGGEVGGPSGQAKVVQTVGLFELGYRGRRFAGRFSPEASVRLGTQHTLTHGRPVPGYHGVWDGGFVFAAGTGLAIAARLAERVDLAVDATALRLLPRPVVILDDVVVGRAQAIAYFVCVSARLRL
jgi:hypothetical protein